MCTISCVLLLPLGLGLFEIIEMLGPQNVLALLPHTPRLFTPQKWPLQNLVNYTFEVLELNNGRAKQ